MQRRVLFSTDDIRCSAHVASWPRTSKWAKKDLPGGVSLCNIDIPNWCRGQRATDPLAHRQRLAVIGHQQELSDEAMQCRPGQGMPLYLVISRGITAVSTEIPLSGARPAFYRLPGHVSKLTPESASSMIQRRNQNKGIWLIVSAINFCRS